jgi:hypothetical protein
MRKSIGGFATIVLALASIAGVSLLGGFGVSPAGGTSAVVSFEVSPSQTTGGIAFSQQPVVSLSGAATATALVTLAISTGPGTLTCTSGTTINAVNFVATFSGCSIDKAFNGYVLEATDQTDTGSNTSASFNIVDGAPFKLGFTTQPTSGSAGNLFVGGNIGSPVVTIEDAGGNPAASNPANNSTIVTMVISPNPSEGTLSCTNTSPAVVASGNAIFGLCAINKENTGTGYTLFASAPGLIGATSGSFNVTYTTAAPSQLVFTLQPAPDADETVGAAFTIEVALEDTFGNLESDNSTIDVQLTFTGSATFGCTGALGLEASTSLGVAEFVGCSDNTAQLNAGITAAATNANLVPNGIDEGHSNLFNFVEQATHLVFTVEPGNGTAGSPIAPQPVVNVEGAGGVTVSSTDLITLTIGTNPGGGSLTCGPVAAIGGVASFTNCAISEAGNGYTLVAADSTNPGTITPTTSSTFNITAGSGDHLVFTLEPGGTTTQVSVETPGGTVVTGGPGSGDLITLGIGTNPSGGSLTCTPTDAVAGVATFTGCTINMVGNGYTLTATDSTNGATTPATSTPFNVPSGGLGGGPATHLAFISEPGNGAPGHPISEQPIVAVENAAGVPVSSTDVINLTVTTNPGSGTLTCAANPLAAAGGVSAYSGCGLNNGGTGYVLTATDTTDGALTAAVSTPFNVSATTPLPTQIFGPTAIGTSISVSQAEFPVAGSAHAVVLARSDYFSDALAGGPLAAAVDGPLLITPGADLSATLDPGVQAEILRVLPLGDTVYILGGVLALSPTIDATLVRGSATWWCARPAST